MKVTSLVVQGVLVILLALALWRVVARGGASRKEEPRAPTPNQASVFVDPAAQTSYKAGILRIPVDRLRPLPEGEWVVGATHFVVEEMGGEQCVLAVGELVRLNDTSLSMSVDGKPRPSALMRFAREAGGLVRYIVMPRGRFRARWPKGLPACGRWVKSGKTSKTSPELNSNAEAQVPSGASGEEVRLPSEPLVLKQGARRALPRVDLVSARILSGTSVVLERRALDEGYVLHAVGTGESLLAVERFPGPHVRHVRVLVRPNPPGGRTARMRAPPPTPQSGVFVVPGWTSEMRTD